MPTLADVFSLIGCWLLVSNAALIAVQRKRLSALWCEPMLRVPVVIFESDDWGAGPQEQADCLRRLRETLARHPDAGGRRPVMTLGLTLAAPRPAAGAKGVDAYARRMLDHPDHADILAEMRRGVADGVFAAQQHGLEHFMPAVICEAAKSDPEVAEWLRHGGRYSELLPDRLQSRWVDARELPSTEHAEALIESEVAEEVVAFERIFGRRPRVVVPNTFVWTRTVEKAWARHGLRYLVTCGKRFVARDAAGRLVDDGAELYNGDECGGLLCLVRDAYFEPAKGHRASDVLLLASRYRDCARPLLLESQRFNFTSLNATCGEAYAELETALQELPRHFPRLRYLSTEELGDAIASSDPVFIERRFAARLRAWLCRAERLPTFRRWTRISGAAPLIRLLLFILRPHAD